MTKLAKYLKPFAAGLVLTIVLLFAQAISELNLPNYMSRIINVGIQQNGIEHAAPDAISQNGMALMTAFMTEPERQTVLASYSLMNKSASFEDSAKILNKYPKAEDSFYIKNSLNVTETDALDSAFAMAALTFVNIMEDMTAPSETDETPDESAMNISRVYELGPVFASSGPEALSAAREEAMLSSAAAAKQSGIMLAKAFYEELGADIGAMQTAYIVKVGLMMLLISLLGGAATVFVSLLSTRIATGAARNLRKDVFEKVESFSSNEFDKFSTASLITRCTNDITQIQMLLMMGIRMICYAPIMGIGGIIMAVGKSPSMSWIIAVAVVVLVGMVMIIMSIAVPKFKIIQKLVDKLNLVAREGLSGLMVVRAFGTQNHEKQRFDKANKDLTQINLFVNRIMVCMMPAMMLIMNGIALIIVWTGAHSIAASTLQVGDMMAFIQYAMQIIMSFLMISMMFIMVPRAAVSAQRVGEVLATESSIKDPENPQKFNEKLRGVVEFKNVHFRYNGAQNEALSNISFTALPSQTTAIIGSTGSGKSTIANLMLRFYDVSEGEICIDGADIRQVRQKDLREKIGYVPQKGVLLSGTIAFNLKYGKKDATDAEMETAASVAQAMEFISEKPERFETEIAQGGANVSGGQKQRISIARALAKDPEIIIFDDSFSALDFKTDAALRNALWKHTSKSTVIVVAQRVSTIMNADQIIVLEKGNIVGRGTHRELLKTCAEYREIAVSQLSEEELA